MAEPSTEVTLLLAGLAAGDDAARQRLAAITYREVKAIAQRQLAGKHCTLQPTVLTHEAYVRLFEGAAVRAADRRQFFGLVAKMIRDLVVDHVRARGAQKRGGNAARVTVDGLANQGQDTAVDALDLSEALDELRERDRNQYDIVEFRFYAGLPMQEIADLMQLSLSTVEREWRAARAWLAVRLRDRSG